jgi:hypothetical protein
MVTASHCDWVLAVPHNGQRVTDAVTMHPPREKVNPIYVSFFLGVTVCVYNNICTHTLHSIALHCMTWHDMSYIVNTVHLYLCKCTSTWEHHVRKKTSVEHVFGIWVYRWIVCFELYHDSELIRANAPNVVWNWSPKANRGNNNIVVDQYRYNVYIYMYTLNTISSAWTWVCQQWQGIRVWTLKKFGCLKSAPPTSTSCICYVDLLLACYALSHMLISCAQLNTSNSLREDHHTDLACRFIPAQESNIIWNEMRYHNFQITIR